MATKRRQYDDKFRASAVVMLEGAGYPDKEGALTRTAKHLGVPAMTLSRWFKAKNNPPPTELVTEKRLELIDLVKNELDAIFRAMPAVRGEASYRDLGTVAGILADKKQLLEGKATERIEHEHSGLTDEQRASRIAELLNASRTRRDGRAADTEFVQ